MVALAPPPPPSRHAHKPGVARGKGEGSEIAGTAGARVAPGASPAVPMYTEHYVEEGMASWYGPQFNGRRAANGKVFDQNAMTAAHRTLPMGSIIKVTNLRTGQSATMEVTDRGPFVPDRMIDLSMGAAKELGIYATGTAPVRLELVSSPKPPGVEGRWCVQIGVFKDEENSLGLKAELLKKYTDSQVLEFTGPDGHWVRIKPPNGDKAEAFQIARGIHPREGNAYLVRLD